MIALACGAVTLLIAASLYAGFNTNLFGPERLCNDLLSSRGAEEITGISGRVSSEQGATRNSGETGLITDCTVRVRSEFPKKAGTLALQVLDEPADFPINDYGWATNADFSYFAGSGTGGVSDNAGWITLPRGCPSRALRIRAVDHSWHSEHARKEMAQALESAAARLSRDAGCAQRGAQDVELHSPSTRALNPNDACGLKGFVIPELARPDRYGQRETERISSLPNRIWTCDIRFKDTEVPQVTMAALQRESTDPSSAAPAGTMAPPSGRPVAKCGGNSTYLSIKASADYKWLIEKQRKASVADAESALFRAFIDGLARNWKCTVIRS
ncbi:hypothetical protein [Streptomyces orinoci]|uniref:Uncharacterized protein n=1 Tax=Streptomyces orinoci TaxID=67339 RepID=A0ABV3K7G6_STRON|nr:hypothetical protein [Streptomyces orinoci]